MKTFILTLTVLFTVNSAYTQDDSKTFVVFGVAVDHLSEFQKLGNLLKSNSNFDMVRIDPSRNTFFIVSKYGFEITEEFLKETCGTLFDAIRCAQYGTQWVDQPKFDELYECNSK